MDNVTTEIILDHRYRKKDGTYSVKIRVTYEREQKYYPIHISLSKENWEKVQSPKPRNEFKQLLIYFNKIEQKAVDVIQKLEPFSFEAFEKNFRKKAKHGDKNVIHHFQDYYEELIQNEQVGTATIYKEALSSLGRFFKTKHRNNKKLNFSSITPEWLQAYEKWMTGNNKSLTSVSIYTRCLRAIFNKAIDEGIIPKDHYPFGKRKYQVPSGRNIKKALSLPEIKAIVNYKPENAIEKKARDLWLFSYLCNGANIKDIARLKYKNIGKKMIFFIRAKTERITKHDLRPVQVPIIPEAQRIINQWGKKPIRDEKYVFGIIHALDDPETERKKIKQATKIINKYMQRIGEKLQIDSKITTYTARHSFATVLKRSGASIEFISESLGHRNIRTTENYLDSFEDSVKEEFQKKLLDFD